MDRCLDDNDVQAFFRGQLSASRTTVIQKHVDECSLCRHLVAEVARSTSENMALTQEPGNVARTTLPFGERHVVITPAAAQHQHEERVVIRDGKISRRPSNAAIPVSPSSRGALRRGGLEPGSILEDRYRLERILGEGGTGVVWEATHIVMRRRVAVKIHKSNDPQAIRRFFREARVTAALKHPNIVDVHDVFTIPEIDTAAMVMELLDGKPLSTFMRGLGAGVMVSRALSLRQTIRVLLPVIDALLAAHTAGVVHRDLKPENVFLVGKVPSLDDPYVKVLDFGLAKLTATEGDVMSTGQLTRSGFVLGTPHYMSPEQVIGDVAIDTRTDVWSLGVLLYELLAGARPIEGDNISRVFRAVLEAKIIPLQKQTTSLPKPVAQMAMRMLSRPRDDRPTLADVRHVLASQM